MMKPNRKSIQILCILSTVAYANIQGLQEDPEDRSFYKSTYVTQHEGTPEHDIDEETLKKEPIVDIQEARDTDYSFFNDPYVLEQYKQQPMHDLTELGVAKAPDQAPPQDQEQPIVDESETRDVDFSFFNDPYAFDVFREGLPVKAKLSGYVQHSAWWDSRQAITTGDGYAFLFPKKREFDVDCRDINARGEFNMGMLETRLRGEFFGPEVVGAESFGYIEADFFGSGVVINRMRLRHAFIELTWKEQSKIMLGQFWHPIFIIRTFPLTVSFDGGAPIGPFSRNPQIRFTHTKNNKEFMAAAIAQLQFVSNGPEGLSSIYLRNSRLPMYMVRGAYTSDDLYAGVGAVFLRLKPRLESNKGFRVNESINSLQATAFATVKFEPLEIRQQLIYAQNGTNVTLLSGYAVTDINPTTDERDYTNTSVLSYWADFNINRKIEPGLFLGISKGLGANREIIQCVKDPATGEEENTLYSFGEDINTLFRLNPRVRFHVLPIDFATEIEYTRATYGCIDNFGKVQNTDPVSNTRLLFTAFYYF